MDKPAVPHADSCVHFLRLHRGIGVTTGWIDSFYKAICSAGNPIERHRLLSECMCVSPVEMTNLYPWNHRESYCKKFITEYDAPNATLNSTSLVQLFVWVDQLNFQELEVVDRGTSSFRKVCVDLWNGYHIVSQWYRLDTLEKLATFVDTFVLADDP